MKNKSLILIIFSSLFQFACSNSVKGLLKDLNSTTPSAQILTVSQVATGGTHTCAISNSGAVSCWGDNLKGELGTGDQKGRTSPSGTLNFANPNLTATQVGVGDHFTCVLFSAGNVKCFGLNDKGQLGQGNTTSPVGPGAGEMSSLPDTLPLLGSNAIATKIAVNHSQACALLSDGNVACWGNNITTPQILTPGNAPNNFSLPVKDIFLGEDFGCLVDANSKVFCWGKNDKGQTGTGSNTPATVNNPTGPVKIGGSGGTTDIVVKTPNANSPTISGGDNHACVITSDNKLVCWGDDSKGQVGDGTNGGADLPDGTSTTPKAPVVITLPNGGGDPTKITTGADSTCVTTSTKKTYCFGDNDKGQLGGGVGGKGDGSKGDGNTVSEPKDGSTSNAPEDKGFPLQTSKEVEQVVGGGNQTCLIYTDKTMTCFGENKSSDPSCSTTPAPSSCGGKLGDGNTTPRGGSNDGGIFPIPFTPCPFPGSGPGTGAAPVEACSLSGGTVSAAPTSSAMNVSWSGVSTTGSCKVSASVTYKVFTAATANTIDSLSKVTTIAPQPSTSTSPYAGSFSANDTTIYVTILAELSGTSSKKILGPIAVKKVGSNNPPTTDTEQSIDLTTWLPVTKPAMVGNSSYMTFMTSLTTAKFVKLANNKISKMDANYPAKDVALADLNTELPLVSCGSDVILPSIKMDWGTNKLTSMFYLKGNVQSSSAAVSTVDIYSQLSPDLRNATLDPSTLQYLAVCEGNELWLSFFNPSGGQSNTTQALIRVSNVDTNSPVITEYKVRLTKDPSHYYIASLFYKGSNGPRMLVTDNFNNVLKSCPITVSSYDDVASNCADVSGKVDNVNYVTNDKGFWRFATVNGNFTAKFFTSSSQAVNDSTNTMTGLNTIVLPETSSFWLVSSLIAVGTKTYLEVLDLDCRTGGTGSCPFYSSVRNTADLVKVSNLFDSQNEGVVKNPYSMTQLFVTPAEICTRQFDGVSQWGPVVCRNP